MRKSFRRTSSTNCSAASLAAGCGRSALSHACSAPLARTGRPRFMPAKSRAHTPMAPVALLGWRVVVQVVVVSPTLHSSGRPSAVRFLSLHRAGPPLNATLGFRVGVSMRKSFRRTSSTNCSGRQPCGWLRTIGAFSCVLSAVGAHRAAAIHASEVSRPYSYGARRIVRLARYRSGSRGQPNPAFKRTALGRPVLIVAPCGAAA